MYWNSSSKPVLLVSERRVPKYTRSMRPVNCAHAHRAGSAVHVEIAAFEHLRPFRNGVGWTFGPGNHLENSVITIRAKKSLGIKAEAGIDDSGHLGMVNRNASQKDPVLSPRPMILPSLTMTAPNGPPHPFSTDSMASRVAS